MENKFSNYIALNFRNSEKNEQLYEFVYSICALKYETTGALGISSIDNIVFLTSRHDGIFLSILNKCKNNELVNTITHESKYKIVCVNSMT